MRRKFILKHIKKGKVLNLGSEWGELREYIDKHKIKVTNLDIVGKPDVKHDLNDGMPFPENDFDTIIAGEVIEHLLEPYRFLIECFRILKPEGVLILTTPNGQCPYGIWTPFHYHIFKMEYLIKLMETAGFYILYYQFMREDGQKGISKFLSSLNRRFKKTLFVIGEKPYKAGKKK